MSPYYNFPEPIPPWVTPPVIVYLTLLTLTLMTPHSPYLTCLAGHGKTTRTATSSDNKKGKPSHAQPPLPTLLGTYQSLLPTLSSITSPLNPLINLLDSILVCRVSKRCFLAFYFIAYGAFVVRVPLAAYSGPVKDYVHPCQIWFLANAMRRLAEEVFLFHREKTKSTMSLASFLAGVVHYSFADLALCYPHPFRSSSGPFLVQKPYLDFARVFLPRWVPAPPFIGRRHTAPLRPRL